MSFKGQNFFGRKKYSFRKIDIQRVEISFHFANCIFIFSNPRATVKGLLLMYLFNQLQMYTGYKA